MSPKWDDFLHPADQWLIAYAVTPLLFPVTLFSIGHVVELYLKGAYTKDITGSVEQTMKRGHNLRDMWNACKRHNPDFMPSYEIREVVYQTNFISDGGKGLPPDDFNHFIRHQELYLIMKHLTDLKYIGTPLKSVGMNYGIGAIHPNDYWIAFLKELRAFLGYPQPDGLDLIRIYIDRGQLHPHAVFYLEQLYT